NVFLCVHVHIVVYRRLQAVELYSRFFECTKLVFRSRFYQCFKRQKHVNVAKCG
ncbi:unnamed protein product, partial [Staurois parvus]